MSRVDWTNASKYNPRGKAMSFRISASMVGMTLAWMLSGGAMADPKAKVEAGAADASAPEAGEKATPAPHLLDRFTALAGTWSGEGLEGNSAPGLKVSYEVTGGGSVVVETLFAGTPHEMRTVYYKDGADVVLTHYCATGNHPKMRAKALDGDTLVFAFDGASNFDPATAGHMHDAQFVFVGPDEIRTRWNFWQDGKPGEHAADMHMKRVAD